MFLDPDSVSSTYNIQQQIHVSPIVIHNPAENLRKCCIFSYHTYTHTNIGLHMILGYRLLKFILLRQLTLSNNELQVTIIQLEQHVKILRDVPTMRVNFFLISEVFPLLKLQIFSM